MKKMLNDGFVLLLIFTIAGFPSCSWNSEEDLYGIESCDTSNITWEDPVSEILETNCVPCHNPELHYNGVRHDTYVEELKVVIDDRLHSVINHLPGFPEMPYQLPQLPECERGILDSWIINGAPEN